MTTAQQKDNQSKAKTSILVEHLIRLIKIFRVAAERFRLKTENYSLCNSSGMRVSSLADRSNNYMRSPANLSQKNHEKISQ
ncbi:hypothetical protein QUB05_30495 [Microcoleus sp. F10-C6]|uniref:hypothetical protein n=1 Tax=unclassified Microcoleus TaxID=2642155 RepID=UPI002FD35F2E